ncbi:MAG: hypothetical protein WC236_09685 [Gallionellaceae bacterium]|jgi:hypothetical protein
MENVVSINDRKGSISVSRSDLLLSQAALVNLGRVSLPVQKDGYWLAKTLGKINKAMKHELRSTQDESNRLIEEYGTELEDKDGNKTRQKGIQQTDVATMQKYAEEMEKFNSELIFIENVQPVSLAALESAGVMLQLADQAALQWLIEE